MWRTLTELLQDHAEHYPDMLYVRLLRQTEVMATYTYAQTWQWANRWAVLLRDHGLRHGDRVILALPNGDDFLGAYFGTLLAGGLPATAAPFRKIEANDYALISLAERLRFIGANLLIVPEAQANIGTLSPLSEVKPLTILTRQHVPATADAITPTGNGDDLGLLQFTSGTSGNAKVVQLTHTALLTQMQVISTALALHDRNEDWALSWLPLFHDMGLIGYLLTTALHAGNVTLLPVEDFIMRPNLWIKALSDYRASITGAPPSAYALCARRMKESEVGQYDLRRLRIALVGAEPVTLYSLQLFIDKFRPAGLRPTSLMPTYGLAENGLAVTMTPLKRGPKFDTIDLEGLQTSNLARRAEPRRPARTVASVGAPLIDTEVAIMSQTGERLPDRQIGEIVIRTPSLMQGYYAQPELTAQALRDGWLWTGDLGYLAEGELYITGRKKELLIVGGRNYFPDDVEQIVTSTPDVRLGRVVCIAHEEAALGTEVAVILAETGLTDPAERDILRQTIRRRLTQAGYPVSEVILLRPKTIQVTPNGKLKRVECKTRYLAGEFTDGN